MSASNFMLLNSLLLLGVGIMLGMIGFFFKDLHKDFKELVLRVNSLYTELTRHTTQAEANYKSQSEEVKEIKERVRNLEKKNQRKKVMGAAILYMSLIGGAVWLGTGLLMAKNTADHLETAPQIAGFRTTLEAFLVKVNVALKNPTEGKLKIDFPKVEILYEGKVLSSSVEKRETLTIAPHATTWMKGMEIKLPWNDMPGLAPLITRLLAGTSKGVDVDLRITSRVHIGPLPIAFSDTQKVTIKNPFPHASQQ